MRLDRLIQTLLPHDEHFYAFLEESARVLVRASENLRKLAVCRPAEREKIVGQIRDLEHEGDTITHKIFAELNGTFVTPFDREDIHTLASALDDVMDYMDGSAGRFILYKIKNCPSSMTRLIDTLHKSVAELHRGIGLLPNLQDSDELRQIIEKINEYENEADTIFERAIADLFDKEKNPIAIIKMKEIFVGLETATDKCEDAANVLETILIKHA